MIGAAVIGDDPGEDMSDVIDDGDQTAGGAGDGDDDLASFKL